MRLLLLSLATLCLASCGSSHKKIPVVTQYGDILVVESSRDYKIGEEVHVRTNAFVHVVTESPVGVDTIGGEITYVLNAHVLEY